MKIPTSTLSKRMTAAQAVSGDDSFPETAPASVKSGNVLIRMSHPARKELHQLALDENTTLQKLMVEAVRDLMVKYGRNPLE